MQINLSLVDLSGAKDCEVNLSEELQKAAEEKLQVLKQQLEHMAEKAPRGTTLTLTLVDLSESERCVVNVK